MSLPINRLLGKLQIFLLSTLPPAGQKKYCCFRAYLLECTRSATEIFFERRDLAKRFIISSAPASTLLPIERSYGTGLYPDDISMSAMMQLARREKAPGFRCPSFTNRIVHCYALFLAQLTKMMGAIFYRWFWKEIVCRGPCQNYILLSLPLRSSRILPHSRERSECFSVCIVLSQRDGR